MIRTGLVLAWLLLAGCTTLPSYGPHHCTDADDCANDSSVNTEGRP